MKALRITVMAVLALLGAAHHTAGAADAGTDTAVQIVHGGLNLNGSLRLADGRTIGDGVVLITHGTLAHHGMEVIAAMQDGLAERGHSSLAITLGLGVDDRRDMFDCAQPHRHRHFDALDDIGAWLAWLKANGASRVALMGHSRGGAQTALFAAERPDPVVSRVVLLAPMTYDQPAEAAAYQARFGTPLAAPLDKALALVQAGRGETMMDGTGFLYCPGASVSAAAFAGYYQPDPRLGVAAPLAGATVPTLVVAAAADAVVTDLPAVVAPLADGKTVRLITIADADHLFLDFAAADAADAIAAFLEE